MTHASVNHLSFCIAPPMAGKSTLQRSVARALLEAHPASVLLAHDESGDWAREWRLPVVQDPRAWLAAWDAKPRTAPRLASFDCAWSELRGLVFELGRRYNDAAATRLLMVVAIDEAVMLDDSQSSYTARDDKRLLLRRRHLGAAVLVNMQEVSTLAKGFLSTATDVFAFLMPDEDAVRVLERRCAMPRGALAGLGRLAPHRYLHLRPGVGIVREALLR